MISIKEFLRQKGRKRMVKHGAKKVKISEQRKITIPEEFYDALNFQDEVIIEFIGKAIVILPNETVNF